MLQGLGVDPIEVRAAAVARLAEGRESLPAPDGPGPGPDGSDISSLLNRASQSAAGAGRPLAPEDLLLALADDPDAVPGRALARLGVDRESLAEAIRVTLADDDERDVEPELGL